MKKIFCPRCDEAIILSDTKLAELRTSERGVVAVVCSSCTHQIRLRLKAQSSHEATEAHTAVPTEQYGHIVVLENVFGYKQYFPLRLGLNHIGRRNKDTKTDIPVITGDPSMDRHHAIIKVHRSKKGKLLWSLADNDSRVGTFVGMALLGDKEWYDLHEGDVFTLGATTIIFSCLPPPSTDEAIEGEGVH